MTTVYETDESAWKLIGRGKVRDVYELARRDAGRHQRPPLGVRRRPADADPRQGQGADAARRRSGSSARGTSSPTISRPPLEDVVPRMRRAPRRPLDRRAQGEAAAGRGRRARLPRRLGLEGVQAQRHRLRRSRCRPACVEAEQAAGADLHALDQGRARRARREHLVRRGREPSAPTSPSRCATPACKLYRFGADYARQRGIIIADTKFEFGLLDGKLILIDEVLTPDSSRFWPQTIPAGQPPAELRQAVRARLPARRRLEQGPARPGAARRGGAQDLGEVPRGAAAPDEVMTTAPRAEDSSTIPIRTCRSIRPLGGLYAADGASGATARRASFYAPSPACARTARASRSSTLAAGYGRDLATLPLSFGSGVPHRQVAAAIESSARARGALRRSSDARFDVEYLANNITSLDRTRSVPIPEHIRATCDVYHLLGPIGPPKFSSGSSPPSPSRRPPLPEHDRRGSAALTQFGEPPCWRGAHSVDKVSLHPAPPKSSRATMRLSRSSTSSGRGYAEPRASSLPHRHTGWFPRGARALNLRVFAAATAARRPAPSLRRGTIL